jgi:hypothetical protein
MYDSLRAAYQGKTSQPPFLQSWPIDVSQILLGLMFFPMDITSHELRILSCTPLRRRAFPTLLQSTVPVSYLVVSESLRIETVISYQGRGHRRRPDVGQGTRARSVRETSTRGCTYRFSAFVTWPNCADEGPTVGTIAPQLS